MRGFLASSIGVTCATALALPLAAPVSATAGTAAVAPAADVLPGSTQSLPLIPLGSDRAGGPAREEGLARRDVRPFSLVGVVWDDPDADLRGRVQVRTRATGTSTWSAWQDVETHNHDHAADPGSAERATGRVRGATAPLWVGTSDGVEVRVRADARAHGTGARAATRAPDALPLPKGLRLELVDPGDEPPAHDTDRLGALTAEAAASSAVNADLAPLGATAIPALGKEQTEKALLAARGIEGIGTAGSHEATAALEGTYSAEHAPPAHGAQATQNTQGTQSTQGTQNTQGTQSTQDALGPYASAQHAEHTQSTQSTQHAQGVAAAPQARPHIGPRPRIITRRGWGADERLRERNFAYTKTVKAAFVHHSATGNNYRCSQAPSVLRSIYRYHVKSSGWRDFGYNFAVDKCGNIYEGRAGGVTKPVLGAHTLGFNTNSMGIAVLGTFGGAKPPKAAVTAVAKLTAWKLGLFGANPRGTTYLKSGGGNLYRKGTNVRLRVISGHRDGFATECPGRLLYKKLGKVRSSSARYQGR
ncbi:peptidoglycan recognition protein family protein [Streptomyces sp. G45]|uniref:peptidoglycan recognition protein family protein n=1 Tax=Streptomyces sp. G45 TaxID=3406627 RepID=UPI003C1EE126